MNLSLTMCLAAIGLYDSSIGPLPAATGGCYPTVMPRLENTIMAIVSLLALAAIIAGAVMLFS